MDTIEREYTEVQEWIKQGQVIAIYTKNAALLGLARI